MPLEGSRGQLKPMELLFVSLTAAMPAQPALHAVVSIAERLQLVFVTLPVLSRYAHYSPGAHVLWLLVPPVTFVAYQAASMLVLADVEPVMHAVLNTLCCTPSPNRTRTSLLYHATADFKVSGSRGNLIMPSFTAGLRHCRQVERKTPEGHGRACESGLHRHHHNRACERFSDQHRRQDRSCWVARSGFAVCPHGTHHGACKCVA